VVSFLVVCRKRELHGSLKEHVCAACSVDVRDLRETIYCRVVTGDPFVDTCMLEFCVSGRRCEGEGYAIFVITGMLVE